MEDGTVNYKDMNLIENITRIRSWLKRYHRSRKNGMNVVGTELKALEGRPAVIPRAGCHLNPEVLSCLQKLRATSGWWMERSISIRYMKFLPM